ncbi:hypothetical protein V5O48_015517 [Marasmius crinis-equi]|uniref:Uncharacterized protein n=1 Tax=Marasmius crinis-equi TaxID=585013 RepID=A0ABR3EUB2_9AGAR
MNQQPSRDVSLDSMPQEQDNTNPHQPDQINDLCPTDIPNPDEVDIYTLPTSKITRPAPHVEPDDVHWLYQPESCITPFPSPFPLSASLERSLVLCDPPPGYIYPKAPIYTLHQDDWQFPGGCCYSTPFYTLEKNGHHQCLLHTKTPPGTHPRWDSQAQKFRFDPIESMIAMPLGIPFSVMVNGNERNRFARVKSASNMLWNLSWGYGGSTPIYCLPGLQRNMCSGIPDDPEAPDGSYLFAVIQEQGHGRGTISPAVQANKVKAKARIAATLEAMKTLYHEIVPLCITKAE